MDESCGTLVYQAPEQMEGGKVYGKAVDVWAVGFIMYELVSGRHPVWTRGEDKQSYKKKALSLQKLRYSRRISKLQQSLIEKLCHPKPSLRYTVDQALKHPWITRNFDGEIPRNHFEEHEYLNELDEKFRKVLNMVYFLSVVRNHEQVADTPLPLKRIRSPYLSGGKKTSEKIKLLKSNAVGEPALDR